MSRRRAKRAAPPESIAKRFAAYRLHGKKIPNVRRVNPKEALRCVKLGAYKLTLWDTGRTDRRGQTRIGYELRDRKGVIFEGDDFAGSPMHADDSDETVRGLLGFLTLRPGDTDAEYFADYTARQKAFAENEAEELSLYVYGEEPFEDA